MTHDLDAASGLPATLGRAHVGEPRSMTQKEFKRRLDAYMRKKNMPKLILGGGEAPASKAEQKPAAPNLVRRMVNAAAADAWRAL